MSDHEPQEASSSSMETFVAKNDNYHQLQSPSQLQELLSKDLNRISLLYFRAEWAEVCKTTDPLIKSLAQKLSEPLFLEIEAESLPEVTESFEVESVPSFIILRGHELYSRILGTQVSQVESDLIKYLNKTSKNQQVGNGLNQGGRYQTLSETHEKPKSPGPRLSGGTKSVNNNDGSEETEEEVFERCKKLMNQSKVVVFMKVSPALKI